MENKEFYDGLSNKQIIKYAILYPLGLIAACVVAEWLEKICF